MFDEIVKKGNAEQIFSMIEELNYALEGTKEQINLCRNRLLELHKLNGEKTLEGIGYQSTMKRISLSIKYLKEEYGVKDIDLPDWLFKDVTTTVKKPRWESIRTHLKSKGIEIEIREGVSINKKVIERG